MPVCPISDLSKSIAAKRNAHVKTIQKAPPRAVQLQDKVKLKDDIPEAVETQKAVLCAILYNPEKGFSIFERCAKRSFLNKTGQEWFRQMQDFYKAHGHLNPVVFLEHILNNVQIFEPIGGRVYYFSFQDQHHPIEALEYYLEDLRGKYIRRSMIGLAKDLDISAKNMSNDAVSTLFNTSRRLESLSEIAGGSNGHGLPVLVDVPSRFGTEMPPEPSQIIRRILHQGSKLVVGGTSKGRKTFALIDMAISVATGTDWWGFHCKKGAVCYVNFEIQDYFFFARAETICQKKQVELPPGQLLGWNLRGHAQAIEGIMDDILLTLSTRQFALVIIDPVYKGLGARDENKAGDVASLCNELEVIAVKTGAAVAFGAHYSKGNQAMKESVDRIGGSGVFARDPDSILTMTPHDELDAFTVEATLRNFAPISPFVVRWDWPLFLRDDDLNPENLKSAKGTNSGQFKAVFSKEMLLDHLSISVGIAPVELRKRMDVTHGMSKSTFYNFKAELIDKGLAVEHDGELFRASKTDQIPKDSNGSIPTLESPMENQPF